MAHLIKLIIKFGGILNIIVWLFMSCEGQVEQVTISENQKREILNILFEDIDSTTYLSKGFGLVSNDYLLQKPEIKALIPELDSLYDTLKKDINDFIIRNESYINENPTFNEYMINYFDKNNYNDIEFYYHRMVFSGLSIYRNGDFTKKVDSLSNTLNEKINRHIPKLHTALEKYFDTGYIGELKKNSTFWHQFSYKKDGIIYNECIIVYFDPKGQKSILKIYDK